MNDCDFEFQRKCLIAPDKLFKIVFIEMKLNENTKIVGNTVILVPYEKEHVPKYHKWMGDEEIRRLTGSEPLSLEEEYEMQQTWRNDEDKLTFIILSKAIFEETHDEIEAMVGDVNLFIDLEESKAETEIMIAESSARRKGVALESLQIILSYALKFIDIKQFFAKITDDNKASQKLFQERLDFIIVSHSEVFEEYTLELPEEKKEVFRKYIDNVEILTYR